MLTEPAGKAFQKWLLQQLETYRRHIPVYVVRNEIEKARSAAGALMAYEEIIGVLTAGPSTQDTTLDEPFVDPAALPKVAP